MWAYYGDDIEADNRWREEYWAKQKIIDIISAHLRLFTVEECKKFLSTITKDQRVIDAEKSMMDKFGKYGYKSPEV